MAIFLTFRTGMAVSLLLALAPAAFAMKIVYTEEQKTAAMHDTAIKDRLALIEKFADTVVVAQYTGKTHQPDINDSTMLYTFKTINSVKGNAIGNIQVIFTTETAARYTKEAAANEASMPLQPFEPKQKYIIIAHQDGESAALLNTYRPYLIIPLE